MPAPGHRLASIWWFSFHRLWSRTSFYKKKLLCLERLKVNTIFQILTFLMPLCIILIVSKQRYKMNCNINCILEWSYVKDEYVSGKSVQYNIWKDKYDTGSCYYLHRLVLWERQSLTGLYPLTVPFGSSTSYRCDPLVGHMWWHLTKQVT